MTRKSYPRYTTGKRKERHRAPKQSKWVPGDEPMTNRQNNYEPVSVTTTTLEPMPESFVFCWNCGMQYEVGLFYLHVLSCRHEPMDFGLVIAPSVSCFKSPFTRLVGWGKPDPPDYDGWVRATGTTIQLNSNFVVTSNAIITGTYTYGLTP